MIYTYRSFVSSRKWHFPIQTPLGTAEDTNAGATWELTLPESSRVPAGRAGTAALLTVVAFVPSSFCGCPELPRQIVTDTSGGGCPCGWMSGCGAGDGRDVAHGQRGEELLGSGEGDCTGGRTGRERAWGCGGSERAAQQVGRGEKKMKPLKIKAKNRNVCRERVQALRSFCPSSRCRTAGLCWALAGGWPWFFFGGVCVYFKLLM